MKLLVTGGAGFIGSALVRAAIKRDYDVVNLDSLTYAGRLENLSSVHDHPKYTFIHADIRDKAQLQEVFEVHNPGSVMHFAAESHVDRSIDDAGAFIETNIVGTYNLLEAARRYWTRVQKPSSFRFHHISTDEVYGSLGELGQFSEKTAYAPSSPYSAAKASSDHLVSAWGSTYDLPVLITNCSNNYGPYHLPEKLIPLIIINALDGNPLPVYGTGNNVRDWLYVDDHVDALLAVLERGKLGRRYNIGGDNEVKNIDMVLKICAILDEKIPAERSYKNLISFVQDRPGHDYRYSIDSSRIKDELGWKPSVCLEEGLRKTVQWYIDNQAWWRPLQQRKGVGERLGARL